MTQSRSPRPPTSRTQFRPLSLDHLVGGHLQGQRHREAERLGGFEVDEVLEPSRLFYREFTGFGPLQYLVYKNSRTVTRHNVVRSVGHQRASIERFSRI